MAFKAKAATLTFDPSKRYLWQIAEFGNGLKHFGYVTADLKAVVEASGYFNDDEAEFVWHIGDRITVYQVLAITDTQSVLDDIAAGLVDVYDTIVRAVASDTIDVGSEPDFTLTPAAQGFDLGQRNVNGVDNRARVYVQASGAVALYAAVGIDEDFQATELTTTTAAAAHLIGWAADAAMADNDYGWITLSGTNFLGKVIDNCTADAQLYTTATAGVLGSDASTADPVAVYGVVCVAAASGGGGSQLIATYPYLAA